MKRLKMERMMRKTLIGVLTFSMVTTMFYVPNSTGVGEKVNAAANEEVRTFWPTGSFSNGADTNKSSGTLGGNVVMEKGMYKWTVPKSGVYMLTVKGAQGGHYNITLMGGKGAIMNGTASLKQGDVLTILVGQKGQVRDLHGGGGGGSFVVYNSDKPLAVAGGGGGTGRNKSGQDANSMSTSGTAGTNANGEFVNQGGTMGQAGQETSDGGAGAGFKQSAPSDAGGYHMYHATKPGFGGVAYNSTFPVGGFGGGGASIIFNGGGFGGGGGGYSGGGSGVGSGGGGGGGSFSALANQDNQATNTGDGSVTIKYLLADDEAAINMKSFQPTGAGRTGTNTDKSVGGLGGAVEMKNGMYIWTVPTDGIYRFTAKGAQGGEDRPQKASDITDKGGQGAIMSGHVSLKKDDKLTILVGQRGGHAAFTMGGTNGAGAGGGGTYVYFNPESPLVIAGGGGGSGLYSALTKHASLTTSGNQGSGQSYSNGPGGVEGLAPTTFSRSGVGAGFLSTYDNGLSGSHPTHATTPGYGGPGGGDNAEGGFGGGGTGRSDSSSHVNANAGGGGGYSGGNNSSGGGTGGGGGSYSVLKGQDNQIGNTGDGEVLVELLPPMEDEKVFKPTGVGQKGNDVDASIGGLGGAVVMENGMYKWTVPKDGIYEFVAKGAKGGSAESPQAEGGNGAIMKGKKALKKGEVLTILVGQKGLTSTAFPAIGSGGGGTFVAYGPNHPLVIAGGGGGGGGGSYILEPSEIDASVDQHGMNGSGGKSYVSKMGGLLGNGGAGGSEGGGGAGFFTGSSSNPNTGGTAMFNSTTPGHGGSPIATYGIAGGFGGGGSSSYTSSSRAYSGGGGGYSGGNVSANSGAGGGGGSYSHLEDQENVVGHTGHGELKVTYIEEITDRVIFKNTAVGKTGSNTDRSVGSLNEAVVMENGKYKWTVPKDGLYRFEAKGAGGGASPAQAFVVSPGGKGAILSGEKALKKGEVLTILVGQKGQEGSNTQTAGGGGGGTYVYSESKEILLVAGGGGGASAATDENYNTRDANLNLWGQKGGGASESKAGGNLGQGGRSADTSGGGAGHYQKGLTISTMYDVGGYPPYDSQKPGHGGTKYDSKGTDGGFGGGGSGNYTTTAMLKFGGGGGGYSGGGAGGYGSNGGGGGSFNALANPVNKIGNNEQGEVTITFLDPLQNQLVFKNTNVGRTGSNTNKAVGGLSGAIVMENGMYKWTVPKDGIYEIEAKGARGGMSRAQYNLNMINIGGKGAVMKGQTKLKKGTILTILVGQQGPDSKGATDVGAGGGGGTFIAYDSQTPLVVAGGGGGAAYHLTAIMDANLTTSGRDADPYSGGKGGVDGSSGGLKSIASGGGGGFNVEEPYFQSMGYSMYHKTSPGYGGRDVNINGSDGGFGGGGASLHGGGGGGGYSGGGAGGSSDSDSMTGTSGGGGGSYSALDEQENRVDNNENGLVTIKFLQSSASPISITGMSPANNSTVSGNAINFTWSGSAEAEQYHLEIGTAPGLKDVLSKDDLTKTLHKLNVQPDKNYFWRVRAYTEDAGWGEWSQEWQVRSVFPVLDFLAQYQTADGKTITQSTAQKQIVAVGSTVRLHFTPRNHRVLEYAVSHVYQGRITNLNKRGAYGSDTESNYIGLDFSQPLRGLNGETIKAEKGSVFIIDFKVSSETGTTIEKQVKVLVGEENAKFSDF